MKNKSFIITLTAIITLLCVYYLSFTFISRSVQNDATEYATDQKGNLDFYKKQAYLDSVWTEPVYNLFGIKYTYQEVKETELSLGLDLQGGMHVTLEVSPVDIFKGLSGYSENQNFNRALELAQQRQQNSQASFVDLFYSAFKEIAPDENLAKIFANAANR
ncbi:MAG: protein translocase subunit SecDF, partial [Cyclobacteriaceae bacterium]|nr:protein translocase subunit SecDF [Cyclobacteriaceae bacterium]